MKQPVILILLILGLAIFKPAWAMKKIVVDNLPFATTSADVKDLAGVFGSIISVKVRSIDNNGETSTFAVIKFTSPEDADSAVAALDGYFYLNSRLGAKSKKPSEILVVGSKVKDVVRSAGLRSDGDLVQAVSDQVHAMLAAAIDRARKNKRRTVRPYDL